ncbi:MAG: histidine ammonia-lyase [Bacteroidales bacterium]|jgi:histidine ammonia-lyase|nr:histidine ammonia-lyase [Bacteroidales bacterium]
MEIHYINSNRIDLNKIEEIIEKSYKIGLSDDARKKINNCRAFLDKKIESADKPIYGITTGFGSLCNTSISSNELGQLQENLVKSHACGMGDEVESRIVKLMMLLKVQGLSYGNSGVCEETVQRLVDFYNSDVIPVVYQLGSLGASGDLSPLAHMVLPMLGLGEVYYKGEKRNSSEVLKELNLEPLKLKSKEGLALLNGTQFMLSHAVDAALRCRKLFKMADTAAALSIDAYFGRIDPFNNNLHIIRPHKGQIETSKAIRELLEGSEIMAQEKKWVQDPYSFRCVPQVHGASKDALRYVESVIETEMNSVTDNPTVFPDEDLILSGGNFHGQPLALVLDFLAIATAEIGSISERRVYRLISGERGLPPFLVANPGLNSGFMIPQYTAASIVSQNKQLCTPSSVDSLSSSNEQEDHVSMGANAATKLLRVVSNVERVIAIECFAASQALYLREPLKTSVALQKFLEKFRKNVEFVDNDIIMYHRMDSALNTIKNINFN